MVMSKIPAGWEVVIGLETHVQLSTVSKIFSGSSTSFGAPPNTHANAVDLALPGTLPVMNLGAVERAIQFGLAIGATIAPHSIFARKNYFYPDLPKGYQISQYELPVVVGGTVTAIVDGTEKVVQLTRAHLEEDAGKSLHEGLETPGVSGIDLNRAGTPLLEIVTEPVMHSATEAVAYAKALHGIVTWLGISDGNMQEGSFRCDANVSVRRAGETKLGTRAEIKNVNSFRFLERAIDFEIRRQIELIEDGGKVVQETRLYDAERDETRSMRSKEDAMDYRYFPDPDLLPLEVSADDIARISADMPELPEAMCERFVRDYLLPKIDALFLTSSRETAEYFEVITRELGTEHAKLAANWMKGELLTILNREDYTFAQAAVRPEQVARILEPMIAGQISRTATKELLNAVWQSERDGKPRRFGRAATSAGVSTSVTSPKVSVLDEATRMGLLQVSDAGVIEKIVDEVLAANQKSVDEFKSGKEKAFQALVGQVMKASKGKANPAQVNEILKKKLA
jgi:aspartyl-tRNA(Asn)/glutamyl-tRNA(Gln) amidotransferase subunit B